MTSEKDNMKRQLSRGAAIIRNRGEKETNTWFGEGKVTKKAKGEGHKR